MHKIFFITISVSFVLILSCATEMAVNGNKDKYYTARMNMVDRQIAARGIKDKAVLDAMRKVKRHLFVPEEYRDYSYNDYPLSIGHGQTISQPYIVALMTELAEPEPDDKVLEVGTGSGYQAAILAEIVKEVYSVEIVEPLYEKSKEVLQELDYKNVHLKQGDGYHGWEEHAPYDAIIATAAPAEIPAPLIEQLKTGGRLVIPVGKTWQELVVITKTDSGIKQKDVIPVRFVPMTGDAGK